jgi:hypothetical protein
MVVAAIMTLLLGAQQLQALPHPGVVGSPLRISVRREDAPCAAVGLVVDVPGGTRVDCGYTGEDGRIEFRPTAAGMHVFRATIDGVEQVLPVPVAAAEPRWPRLLVGLPLGFALLWWNVRRARGRRGS